MHVYNLIMEVLDRDDTGIDRGFPARRIARGILRRLHQDRIATAEQARGGNRDTDSLSM